MQRKTRENDKRSLGKKDRSRRRRQQQKHGMKQAKEEESKWSREA